jgi:Catalytic LigB subunit of aromatic ring-opening dioxygenase
MAQLVGTFVSSHAPMMAASVESAPPEQRRNFLGGVEQAARRVREQGAEAVVICSNEHFTNFFLDNFPQFCVGVGASHWGPVEPWLKIDHGEIPGAPELAAHLASGLPAEGFEPSFSHELRLDHGIMTIYHSIDPSHRLPLVPFIQNCAVKPMPSLRRCYQLGQAIRRVVEGFGGIERVAVVGAGGLSHWIGVPRVGQIDVEFDHWFLERLERGQLDDVLDLPDAELELAGNGAHEIRSWLTIAGLAAPSTAKVLAYEPITPWITGMGVVAYDLEPPRAASGGSADAGAEKGA